MKKLLILFAFTFLGSCQFAHAQAPVLTPCQTNCVTITREAAIQMIADHKQVDADKVQIASYEKTIEDLKKELAGAVTKVAEVSSANTELRQDKVDLRAMLQMALDHTRKKCLPFSVCF